jgi:serine/threonine protein kinase/Leucine-rich repeat (LRR) protein
VLQELDLSWNSFGGAIPGELFSNCGNLNSLNISNNQLGQEVPQELWASCKSLTRLDLGGNNLTGGLPTGSPGDNSFPSLQILSLSNNNITGTVSEVLASLGSCQNLQFLDISYNNFTGSIPPEIGNCTQLWLLNFQGNQLTGTVPDQIGRLGNLQCLGLGDNRLYGSLPQNLTACSKLNLLDANSNGFSGLIPAWLSRLSLQYLVLHTNNFTGGIPKEILTSATLFHLDVADNNLTGLIPAEIGSLGVLHFLRLSRNQFTGSIPSSIGLLSSLRGLDLSENQLTGSIPASLGNLQNLLWLQLSQNSLTGSIPAELSNCGSLLWLNLYSNQLSGVIPANFSSMGRNATTDSVQAGIDLPWPPIDLSECSIVASWIPGNDPPFTNLAWILNRESCQIGWHTILQGQTEAVALSYWQLSSNDLTGPIPEFSSYSKLGCLFVGENSLSGQIPASIDNLQAYVINVSRNHIDGFIPENLCNFRESLQILDLSYNNLSGSIPARIINLTALSRFNISYNPDLTGPVPVLNQFSTFDPDVYLGDTKLCFNLNPIWHINASAWDSRDDLPEQCPLAPSPAPILHPVPPSSAVGSESERKGNIRLMILLVTTFSSLTVLILAASVFWCRTKSNSCNGKKQTFQFVCMKAADQHYDHGGKSSKSNSRRFSSFRTKSLHENNTIIPVASFGLQCLKSLTYSDLMLATDGFSEANIIGDGGFGIVYKAKLGPDNAEVAIKKLIQSGAQGDREFQAEMETLGNIKHENLVPLLGYCNKHMERLLVYKIMQNGSLDDWLYESPEKAAALNWATRLRIAYGTASGLCFLHHECVPMIIHRDIKVSNILLDEFFEARLTDFGLARLLDLSNTHVSTIIAGTPGYVAPEYSQTWKATTKGDVYSFGVVLLELVSGKRPTAAEFNYAGRREGNNLVEWVQILLSTDRQHKVCETVVLKTGDPLQVKEFLTLALHCTMESPSKRPTMQEVTTRLKEIISLNSQSSSTSAAADHHQIHADHDHCSCSSTNYLHDHHQDQLLEDHEMHYCCSIDSLHHHPPPHQELQNHVCCSCSNSVQHDNHQCRCAYTMSPTCAAAVAHHHHHHHHHHQICMTNLQNNNFDNNALGSSCSFCNACGSMDHVVTLGLLPGEEELSR